MKRLLTTLLVFGIVIYGSSIALFFFSKQNKVKHNSNLWKNCISDIKNCISFIYHKFSDYYHIDSTYREFGYSQFLDAMHISEVAIRKLFYSPPSTTAHE